MAIFSIPNILRPHAGGKDQITLNEKNLIKCISTLCEHYPSLKKYFFTPEGSINHFMNIYVNDKDMRYLDTKNLILKDTDQINILLSLAGG